MNDQQRANFDAWYDTHDPRTPQSPFDKNLAWKAWQAALQSPEVIVTQHMAECAVMVRDELAEAGIISKEVATMFLANAVLGYVTKLRKDAERYRHLRSKCKVAFTSEPADPDYVDEYIDKEMEKQK